MTGYWLGKSGQHFMLIKMFTPIIVFSYVAFIFLCKLNPISRKNVIFYLNFLFIVRPDAFSVVIIACIINGFFSYALFPVYLEVASESVYIKTYDIA
jgi:hypothetical protein